MKMKQTSKFEFEKNNIIELNDPQLNEINGGTLSNIPWWLEPLKDYFFGNPDSEE